MVYSPQGSQDAINSLSLIWIDNVVDMETNTKQKFGGFSKRFNFLLDMAEFPSVGTGRAKALASQFGCSKSGAQNWVCNNLPPKRETLNSIVAKLITRLSGNLNKNQVIAWLEHGDSVTNPFTAGGLIQFNKIQKSFNHILLSRVYVAVHKIAKAMQLDIYSIDDKVMDHIYNSVIQKALDSKTNEPDKYLIVSLLRLCQEQEW